ncbi:MAG: sulfatase-like hydrolase/transferase [Rikenellaceae bacterium]
MKRELILSSALLSTAVVGGVQAQSASKPDVLFLFIDDMTYDGLNVLGNDEIISPNLDRLIGRGVSFTNNYQQGGWGGAISIASRSQLMTGLQLWNTSAASAKDKYQGLMSDRVLWPQVMHDAGYNTFFTGKWHMADVHPDSIYDKTEVARIGGMPQYRKGAGYNRPQSEEDNTWLSWDPEELGYWVGGKHWSEVQADVTIDHINRSKDSREPLFITCSFNAVHDPRQAPKEYFDMYETDKIALPESFQEIHPLCEQMGSGKNLRDEKLAPFPRTEYSVKRHRHEYYALITHLDAQIGRIIEALEASGRADNTLIVIAADNGLAVGQHGLLGKQSMYDHSMKVPLIFVGCGLPEGEERTQLAYMQDLVPTIYEIAGIEQPATMQFHSQLSQLKSRKAKPNYESVYGSYMSAQRMVRNERYKLFMIPKAQSYYLFDVVKDPLEMNDLSGDKRYAKVIKELAQQYLDVAAEAGDKFDIKKSFPELFE